MLTAPHVHTQQLLLQPHPSSCSCIHSPSPWPASPTQAPDGLLRPSALARGCLHAAHPTGGGEQEGVRWTADWQIKVWGGGQCASVSSPTTTEFLCLKTKTSLVAQTVKNSPAMQEMWVRSLGREGPLGKEMANHSSTLAWRIPWTEEPGGLQSMGLWSWTQLSD